MTDENTVPDHGGGSGHSPHPVPFVKGKRASTPDDDETWKEGEVSPTLNAFDNGGDSRATVVAVEGAEPVAYGIRSDATREGSAKTPSADAEGKVRLRDPGLGITENLSPTLDTGAAHIVAAPEGVTYSFDSTWSGAFGVCEDQSPPMKLGNGTVPAVGGADLAVRRLTPRECERLMGWPDDWTRWAADGSEVADSSRYRMCGNGVASPVAEWIGRCIVAAHAEVDQ